MTHQPGVYVPLRALFLVFSAVFFHLFFSLQMILINNIDTNKSDYFLATCSMK